MSNLIHLLGDMDIKENVKEKSLKLRFTKLEVGTDIKDIFGKQTDDLVEKGLADSLTTEATMIFRTRMEKRSGKRGVVLSIFQR